MHPLTYLLLLALGAWLLYRGRQRLALSRAKHPSLRGHARISRLLARQVPYYEYGESEFFACDGADRALAGRRRDGFFRLAERLAAKSPATIESTRSLTPSVSDMQFTSAYRVPFQFRSIVQQHLPSSAFATETDGVRVCDPDGNWAYDLSGSYGVNLYGYDFYKQCIERAVEDAGKLGPVLGPYHPLVADNVERIKSISGLDEVSFHMSGTEAVMQAVRLARYHTRRRRTVVFCGAYHGWWDGVQPGVGNQRSISDIYTLEEMSDATLAVLRNRTDIACVLVNPLQALHPNAGASSDAMLVASDRGGRFDRDAYTSWLRALREICTARGIVLIFDEVFVGFRLGLGGAQEYFGISADMVTYGKTLGGGLPVGVLTGRRDLMKRFRANRPTDVCFARGTFNSHPYVMAAMNRFLTYAMEPAQVEAARAADALWTGRANDMNQALEVAGLPVRVVNMSSIWMLTYLQPGRYNWMLQYYLRAEGLALSWVGTGRFIFSHNYTDDDFAAVRERIIAAARAMQADGWWTPGSTMTNKSIRQQVLRELLAARLGRRPTGKKKPAVTAGSPQADSA
jgi:glutamate-1-semialdehyde 2,1-aminomutase